MNKMKGICLLAHDAHSRNIIMYFIEIVFLWEMTEAWFWYQKGMLLATLWFQKKILCLKEKATVGLREKNVELYKDFPLKWYKVVPI